MHYRLLVVLSFISCSLFSQKNANTYVNFINPQSARTHLEYLAGEDLEGREAGQVGQKKAAVYLSQQFNSFGIPPVNGNYYQRFPLREIDPTQVNLTIGGTSYSFMKEFLHNADFNDTSFKDAPIIFIGYGIEEEDFDEYENLNVNGKVVIIRDGEPKNKKGIYTVSGTEEKSKWSKRKTKIQLAVEKGAKAIIVISPTVGMYRTTYKHYFSKSKMKLKSDEYGQQIPVLSFDEDLADDLLKSGGVKKGYYKTYQKIDKKGKVRSQDLSLKCSFSSSMINDKVTSENVLGYVEGSDLKDELVIVTAHYDHIGKHDGHTFYGADDDGSGTTALILMAQAFAKAKEKGDGPRRSILFMPVSAEEKGLLGSRYYSENPIFPLKNTVADLNIDMIGRIDKAHEGNPNYVYIIGSDFLSTELHNINENQNKLHTNLELDYTYNSTDDPNNYYRRSDHYNFAKHGIPVIFYFNGTHEDYHQPTDTVDKIDFNKLSKITRLVYYTAWELANKNERPVVDGNVK